MSTGNNQLSDAPPPTGSFMSSSPPPTHTHTPTPTPTPQLQRGTRLHEDVAPEAELLELAVQLAPPAGKQKAPHAPRPVLQHPVDGRRGLAAVPVGDAQRGKQGTGSKDAHRACTGAQGGGRSRGETEQGRSSS